MCYHHRFKKAEVFKYKSDEQTIVEQPILP